MAALPPDRLDPGLESGLVSEGVSIRGLAEAADYLEGLINLERLSDFPRERLNLGPIRQLLDRLGDPERGLSVLHVAGSKGKGSTSLFAESILRAASERVGTFTSPHLESWTERFRIAGREVEGDALARVVDSMRPHVEALRRDPKTAPSFFDATTAAAILLFRDARVDRAILEVGLGGRLDSTNAIQSAVTCITSIELEHTDKLGNTLAEIAVEKAGILKPGVPCVMGRLPEEAAVVVRERARLLGAPLCELGRDFDLQRVAKTPRAEALMEPVGVSFEARDGFSAVAEIGVLGDHQISNAAVAIEAVRLLRRTNASENLAEVDRETAAAVSRGLVEAQLPGRIEVVGRQPWVIVDGAHTAASARVLAEAVLRFPARRRHLVLSVSAGKNLAAILAALVPGAARITVTRAEARRSLPANEVEAAVRGLAPDLELSSVSDPHQAVRQAREALAPEDLLCVAGSIYLAGVARSIFLPRNPRASSPAPHPPAADELRASHRRRNDGA